jgi:hypothetical protein
MSPTAAGRRGVGETDGGRACHLPVGPLHRQVSGVIPSERGPTRTQVTATLTAPAAVELVGRLLGTGGLHWEASHIVRNFLDPWRAAWWMEQDLTPAPVGPFRPYSPEHDTAEYLWLIHREGIALR